jgi:hypothetical protein
MARYTASSLFDDDNLEDGEGGGTQQSGGRHRRNDGKRPPQSNNGTGKRSSNNPATGGSGRRRKQSSNATTDNAANLGETIETVKQRFSGVSDKRKKRREQENERRKARDQLEIPEENILLDENGQLIGIIPTMKDGWACEYYYTTRQIMLLRIFAGLSLVAGFLLLAQTMVQFSSIYFLGFFLCLSATAMTLFRSEGLSIAGRAPMPEIPYLLGVMESFADFIEERTKRGVVTTSRKAREKMAKARGVDIKQFEGQELPAVLVKDQFKYDDEGKKILSPGTQLRDAMNNLNMSEMELSESSNLDIATIQDLLYNNKAEWMNMNNLNAIARVFNANQEGQVSAEALRDYAAHYGSIGM